MHHLHSTCRLYCIVIAGSLFLSGCGLSYYWQAATGHLQLMRQAVPVAEVIANPKTPPGLRDKLVVATAVVAFAHQHLLLPDNGSYASFADLGRPAAVWNVVAAPPLSLEPRTWCFPVAGCVSYRGYFARDSADAFAAGPRAAGDDVFVAGVAAYSTLGRFADPLLNTMLGEEDYRLAGTIFHELAHQRIYLRDDSQFNEGFASFVAAQGIRRWLLQRGDERAFCRYRLERRRQRQVLDLLGVIRRALGDVYELDSPDAARLKAKAELLATLEPAYQRLKASWAGPPDFDHWFATPFNNARLAAIATYEHDVAAFATLFARSGGDFGRFYQRAGELAALSASERQIRLDALRKAPSRDESGGEVDCP
ncbi:MAG: aminopeptidase [Gammaproteobacteria bacterium]|nr:aminopeptidase [Gammaproteobacteria bacterium]MDP7153587.1 aminopeptidase [Gammaproteobacteria bacterium]MDP7296258.1 aminopeptidase [Gammaproteobacteria bacterium]MDP7419007.1 aminopeptidase [Gammaproteobacteria bacterium]MDP7660514.1 aminopeptidase [Gammaproteobacteria bacterium]